MTDVPAAHCQRERMAACAHMAGVVAHEINNALAVISSYAELAARSLSDVGGAGASAAAIDDLTEIGLAAASTARLTGRLTAFARGGVGAHAPVQLEEAVRAVAATLPEGCTVHVDVGPGLPAVLGNPDELQDLVAELLRNAAEAMPDGGRVHVVVASAPPHVELLVHDDGPGMDPETLDRAFDPFFTTKGRGAARGLGLALVYGVVERAGGSVRLDAAPGSGTTATVLLPAAD